MALYLDDIEGYHFNLEGESPWIFVIGEYADVEDESGEIVPLLVTLSYDEAASYMETDSLVFNLPIPGEIQLWVERYVLDDYRPVEKRNVSTSVGSKMRGYAASDRSGSIADGYA